MLSTVRCFTSKKGNRYEFGDWYDIGHHDYWCGRRVSESIANQIIKGGTMSIKFLVEAVIDFFYGENQVAVAGGYARDLYYKRQPKDADIFVAMGPGLDDSDVFETTKTLASFLRQMGCSVRCTQAYESAVDANGNPRDFDTRIYTLLVVEKDDIKADILMHRSATIAEVIETFDANINQAIVSDDMHGVHWPNGTPEKLVFLRPALKPERIAKMQRIAKEIGLEV